MRNYTNVCSLREVIRWWAFRDLKSGNKLGKNKPEVFSVMLTVCGLIIHRKYLFNTLMFHLLFSVSIQKCTHSISLFSIVSKTAKNETCSKRVPQIQSQVAVLLVFKWFFSSQDVRDYWGGLTTLSGHTLSACRGSWGISAIMHRDQHVCSLGGCSP